jgi:hypothetical protein
MLSMIARLLGENLDGAFTRELGMRTFDWALFELYNAGHIAYEEALRNADSANELPEHQAQERAGRTLGRRAGRRLVPGGTPLRAFETVCFFLGEHNVPRHHATLCST